MGMSEIADGNTTLPVNYMGISKVIISTSISIYFTLLMFGYKQWSICSKWNFFIITFVLVMYSLMDNWRVIKQICTKQFALDDIRKPFDHTLYLAKKKTYILLVM